MSNATTTFFTSRVKAEAAANSNPKVDFKDFGKDSKRGKRWATVASKATKSASGTSMKSRAVKVIQRGLDKEQSRQTILAKLVNTVGLTKAGASTYYANVKNGT